MANKKTFIRVVEHVNRVAKQMAACEKIPKELLVERAIQFYAESNYKHIPHIGKAFEVENCSMQVINGHLRCS